MLNHAGLSDIIQSNAANVMVSPKPMAIGPDHFYIFSVSRISPVASWAMLVLRNQVETTPQKVT